MNFKEKVPEFNLQYRTCERCGRKALLVVRVSTGLFFKTEIILCPDCFAVEATEKLIEIATIKCGRCERDVVFFYYVVWTVADAWCTQCAEEVLEIQVQKRNVEFL